jgi:hypothetical protein
MELARTAETSDNFVSKRARASNEPADFHLALVLSRRAAKRAKARTFSLRISRGTSKWLIYFLFYPTDPFALLWLIRTLIHCAAQPAASRTASVRSLFNRFNANLFRRANCATLIFVQLCPVRAWSAAQGAAALRLFFHANEFAKLTPTVTSNSSSIPRARTLERALLPDEI